jgi:hypothetical protein
VIDIKKMIDELRCRQPRNISITVRVPAVASRPATQTNAKKKIAVGIEVSAPERDALLAYIDELERKVLDLGGTLPTARRGPLP